MFYLSVFRASGKGDKVFMGKSGIYGHSVDSLSCWHTWEADQALDRRRELINMVGPLWEVAIKRI